MTEMILFTYPDTAWEIIQNFATELIEKKNEVTGVLDQMQQENVATLCPAFLKMIEDTEMCNCAIHESGLQTPAT